MLVAGGFDGSAELYDPASGTWSATGPLSTARTYHTATLLPNGKVLVAGGQSDGGAALAGAELYDTGLGFNAAWRPLLDSATSPLTIGGALTAGGAGWRGVGFTEAAGGGTNSSDTNYPLLQLYRMDNAQTLWLPTESFSATALTSLPVAGYPQGHALATVFVNGVPSQAKMIRVAATATLTVIKVLDPPDDPGRFDLTIAGVGTGSNRGHGGSYSQTLPTGVYTVTERASAGTTLGDYTAAYACSNGLSGSGTSITDIELGQAGVTCTFTNTRTPVAATATLTVIKVLDPPNDPGRFDLTIAGVGTGSNRGHGGSYSQTLPTGAYAVTERASAGTTLDDYTAAYACSNGLSGFGTFITNIELGQAGVTCTFTNTHTAVAATATLTVIKVLDPPDDPGRFDLTIAGVGTGSNRGHRGSFSQTLPAGVYTVTERASAGTTLGDYTAAYACSNGLSGSGTSITNIELGQAGVTCTFTNTHSASDIFLPTLHAPAQAAARVHDAGRSPSSAVVGPESYLPNLAR